MEGHHTQFEGQARHHKDQAKDQDLVLDLTAGNHFEHRGQVQRTCGAVQHGHAVQQEARGHGTQHKVLHGRFSGLHVVAAQSHQGIARQREQFKAQIQNQKVLTRDHDAHTEQCKYRQAEDFTTAQHVAIGRIRARIDQGHHHSNG